MPGGTARCPGSARAACESDRLRAANIDMSSGVRLARHARLPRSLSLLFRTVRPIPHAVPALWVQEIKHDGYRFMCRVFGRRGLDRTDHTPWIVGALRSLRVSSATLAGEAVVCDGQKLGGMALVEEFEHWEPPSA
jgi:ATP-dependent DNA ligase